MNDLSKMYQVYVNKELQVNKNEILNVARLKQKTLSFLHDLGEVCQDSRCFIFWEKEEAIHHDELLEHYLDGLKMLMSIGYELRIDTIKNRMTHWSTETRHLIFKNLSINDECFINLF